MLYDANGLPITSESSHQEENTKTAQHHAPDHSESPAQRSGTNNPPVSADAEQDDCWEKKTYRLSERGLLVQVALCFFTALAFVAAAYYAYVANQQKKLMHAQLNELSKQREQMTQQTTLLTQQLKGTMAATVEVSVGTGVNIGNFDTPFNGLTVILSNGGHTIASDISALVSTEQLTTSGQVISSAAYPINLPVLPCAPNRWQEVRRIVMGDADKYAAILEAAKRLEQTLRVEWRYSYNDGFGDRVKVGPYCREYLETDWIDCDNFATKLRDLKSKRSQ